MTAGRLDVRAVAAEPLDALQAAIRRIVQAKGRAAFVVEIQSDRPKHGRTSRRQRRTERLPLVDGPIAIGVGFDTGQVAAWIGEAGDLTSYSCMTSGDAESVAIRMWVDLDDDSLDGDAWRLATTDGLHPYEAGSFQLRERSGQVWPRPAHLDQFRHGSRFAIADQGEQ